MRRYEQEADLKIKISHELVEKLADWSEPVQIRAIPTPDGEADYDMDVRRYGPERAES